jgi:acetoacetyl-CoA synthetase
MAGESERGAFAASLGQAGVGVNDVEDLPRLARAHPEVFWRQWLAASGLQTRGSAVPTLVRDTLGGQTFFPGLRLNVAENLIDGRGARADAAALTVCHADGRMSAWPRAELQRQVERLAQALRRRGVGEGDRVALIPRGDAQAVVAVLAVAAVGASLAIVSPETGVPLMVDRFRPLAPRVLLAHAGAMPHDSGQPLAQRVMQVVRALPSLEWLVVLDDAADRLPSLGIPVERLSAVGRDEPFDWRAFPFDHPLVITPAVGAQGQAESLVHGAGGVLLEHTKEHRLHAGFTPQDTVFAPASVASPLWLWQLSALASGCEIVLYDGPVREPATLWRIAASAQATVFVVQAPYLRLGERSGLSPGREFDLSRLRALWCSGMTLDDAAAAWVRTEVKDLPLAGLCVATDTLACLVLQQPGRPLEDPACHSLGLDLRAASLPGGDALELVCTTPFPSRPLGFLHDAHGERWREAQLARHPGAWASGERVEIAPGGGWQLRGRVDGVLSVRGTRIAGHEVQAVWREFPEIRDAVMVEQRLPGLLGEGRAVLLAEMHGGATLDGPLIARLRRRLAEAASPSHVPDLLLAVPELPRTLQGEPCREALADLVNRRPLREGLRLGNPHSIEVLRQLEALGAPPLPIGPLPPPPAPGWRSRQDHESYLQTLWQQIFGFSPIGLDDDFFALGGHSLLAARIFADIQRSTGQNLAPTTLLRAPTIRQLAEVMDAAAWSVPVPLVQLRPGSGRPFFLVHSLAGTFLELWAVLRALDTVRPVYGLQARGLGEGQEPHVRVADMAREYIGHMRRVQPEGPYAVGGYSFGGLVAYEIAQQLHRAGQQVELLGLIDTHVHGRYLPFWQWLHHCAGRVMVTVNNLRALPPGRRLSHVRKKMLVLLDRWRSRLGLEPRHPDLVGDLLREANFPPALRRVRGAMLVAFHDYRPEPYPGRALFLRAAVPGDNDPLPVWRKVVRGGLDVSVTPGTHDEMISGANAKALATALGRHL